MKIIFNPDIVTKYRLLEVPKLAQESEKDKRENENYWLLVMDEIKNNCIVVGIESEDAKTDIWTANEDGSIVFMVEKKDGVVKIDLSYKKAYNLTLKYPDEISKEETELVLPGKQIAFGLAGRIGRYLLKGVSCRDLNGKLYHIGVEGDDYSDDVIISLIMPKKDLIITPNYQANPAYKMVEVDLAEIGCYLLDAKIDDEDSYDGFSDSGNMLAENTFFVPYNSRIKFYLEICTELKVELESNGKTDFYSESGYNKAGYYYICFGDMETNDSEKEIKITEDQKFIFKIKKDC